MGVWFKQTMHPSVKEIFDCEYDEIRDFIQDPSGVYSLIRINAESKDISVALCNQQHQIFRVFHGKKAQNLYHSIFSEERQSGESWFQCKDHIAYLGKELKKAETALSSDTQYIQE